MCACACACVYGCVYMRVVCVCVCARARACVGPTYILFLINVLYFTELTVNTISFLFQLGRYDIVAQSCNNG